MRCTADDERGAMRAREEVEGEDEGEEDDEAGEDRKTTREHAEHP
jgi:hypothetical protein